MKKHNYRTKNVNEINWPELGQQLGGEAVTFAVDVAKAQQYALLTNAAQNLSTLVRVLKVPRLSFQVAQASDLSWQCE